MCKLTKELYRTYYREFSNDLDIFIDMGRFFVYQYSEERYDAYWQRQPDLGRVHLAVILQDEPVGEVVLKNIDEASCCCTMSIHLQNDRVKNRGYGTLAEVLALQ